MRRENTDAEKNKGLPFAAKSRSYRCDLYRWSSCPVNFLPILAQVSFLFMLGPLTVATHGQEPAFISPQTRIKGVMYPVYLGTSPKPAAVLKIDRIYTDYQRKGFFRIGLLPMVVADGVTFEFLQPGKIEETLSEMRAWLEPKATSKVLELRKVTFNFPSAFQRKLMAKRVRLLEQGRWQLFDGVTYQNATNLAYAPRALLQVTGKHAGWLTLESTNTVEAIRLFSGLPPPGGNSTSQESP